MDLLKRDEVLICFCKSIEAKRDYLKKISRKDYAYSRVKGSINVDLRKLHDLGPHLCSNEVNQIAQDIGFNINFADLRNSTKAKRCLGEEHMLQLEHVFPVNQTISLILNTNTGECLRSLINETSYTAWILEEEDKRIKEISFRVSPKLSYQNARIELLEKVGEKWIQFDWSRIEAWAEKSVR